MLAEERRFQIREILTAQHTVSAKELRETLNVTAVTIRRDRIALADNGKFGKQSFAFVGSVTDIYILVTDAHTDFLKVGLLREATS